jgi:DNA repair exonuclease SbcCD ATPase subunit
MDVKLQNAYVEVLLDNFMSVVKQNIMFQAQLKTLSDSSEELIKTKKALEELSEKYLDCEKRYTESGNLINALRVDNTNKESQIVNASNLQKEKDRLQVAANDYMRQVNSLREENKSFSDALNKQNKYIESLESLVPITKLKKIKSAEDDDIKNGGSF